MSTRERVPAAGLLLLGIVVLAAALRLIFFAGYVGGDDAAYISHAYAYAQGDFTVPYSHWGVRSAIVMPTALAFHTIGVTPLAITFAPMTLSMLGVVLAYLLGKRLFDQYTGLVAALCVAVFPSEVIFASHLFPSAYLSTLSTAALLAFVHATERRHAGGAVAAGLLLGGAYLSNITGLFALLFFALYALCARAPLRVLAGFAAGLGAVIAVEALWGLWQSGDLLQRLTVNIQMTASRDSSEAIRFEPSLAWLFEPFVRPLTEQEIGPWWGLMLLAASAALLRLRTRGNTILLLWCIPIFLYSG